MKKQYLITIETSDFKNIFSIEDKNIVLMDEKKFHDVFLKAIENQIERLLFDELVESLEMDMIFPEEWDVLKDMVTVKFQIDPFSAPIADKEVSL